MAASPTVFQTSIEAGQEATPQLVSGADLGKVGGEAEQPNCIVWEIRENERAARGSKKDGGGQLDTRFALDVPTTLAIFLFPAKP